MLTMFAAQASVGIQNAELYQETRRRAEQSAGLARISAIAASTLDLDELMRRMMAETVALLSAEKGIVLLLDERQETLKPHPAAFYGAPAEQVSDLMLDASARDFRFSVVRMDQLFRSDNAQTDRRITLCAGYRAFIERFAVTTLILHRPYQTAPSAKSTSPTGATAPLRMKTRNCSRRSRAFTSAIHNAQLYAETRGSGRAMTLTDIGYALVHAERERTVGCCTSRLSACCTPRTCRCAYDETHDEAEFALASTSRGVNAAHTAGPTGYTSRLTRHSSERRSTPPVHGRAWH
jgi:hypothetical protein